MIHDFEMIADASNNLYAAFRIIDQITPVFIGYRVENETMYLYRYKPRQAYEKVHYFPFGIKSEFMAQFVWSWIEETRPQAKQPSDRYVKKAFEFVANNLDNLDEYQATIKISVCWQVIGKQPISYAVNTPEITTGGLLFYDVSTEIAQLIEKSLKFAPQRYERTQDNKSIKERIKAA